MESKGNEQNRDSSSSPSSRDKSSDTLNTTESSSPENSDSSKISFESLDEKSGSPSSDLDVVEEKPSVLLKPLPKEKLTFLNLNKKKREFPAQKNAEQQDSDVRDILITLSEKPNEVGENSSLLSNIRKPVKRAPEKKEDLTKDWEKLGTSEDELTFKRESGNLTDDPDSISFEGDIGVSKKNVLALKNSQALDEKSKKHILQRVVLEGSGSDEWSFELISDQKGRSDYKGKELLPFCINGEEDDPEERRGGFYVEVDDISPAMRAFLLHANYVIEGKLTWRQIGFGALGIPIGIGVGNAMPSILFKSLKDLGPTYFDIIGGSDLAENLFVSHTAISLGIDSISRNARILGEMAEPSLEEFSIPKSETIKNIRRGFLILTYGGAGIAALLPFYYLWDAQSSYREKHPDDKTTIPFFGCLVPTLWLDSLFITSRAVKNWIDEKINNICIRQAYADQLAPVYLLRQRELSRFQNLVHIFETMDDEKIRKAYKDVYTKTLHPTKSDTSLSEDQVKIFDAIHTLRVLSGARFIDPGGCQIN